MKQFLIPLTEPTNKNIHQINALEVIYFEELKLPVDADFDPMLQEEYTLSSLLSDISSQSQTFIQQKTKLDITKEYDLADPNILKHLQQFGISFDNQELEYYKTLYQNINRKPNIIELFDLCQSNSEHSRHFF